MAVRPGDLPAKDRGSLIPVKSLKQVSKPFLVLGRTVGVEKDHQFPGGHRHPPVEDPSRHISPSRDSLNRVRISQKFFKSAVCGFVVKSYQPKGMVLSMQGLKGLPNKGHIVVGT
jgi:hypothetical protein